MHPASWLLLPQAVPILSFRRQQQMITNSRSFGYSAVLAAALSLESCSPPPANSQSASAPAAAQHRFNVYFDVAKSTLTPEAQQVIAQAVTEANRDASAKVVVLAPTPDIGGTHGRPQRRADTVQAALVAGGVAPERIDARSAGYPEPAPHGVRDPRNRAVEITVE
jgi:outer membrane protein OmpA-like peptidoglycan-associated protein